MITHWHYAEFHRAECNDLFIVMLNVIMLSIIMVNVVLVIVMSRIHLVLLINIWGKVFLQTIYQFSIYTRIPKIYTRLVFKQYVPVWFHWCRVLAKIGLDSNQDHKHFSSLSCTEKKSQHIFRIRCLGLIQPIWHIFKYVTLRWGIIPSEKTTNN
jgi:hypothetical protein